jgi:ankyrin repeat protein
MPIVCVIILNSDGSTPLYIASQEGHVEVVKILLKYNADVHATFSAGYTPLYIAAQKVLRHFLSLTIIISNEKFVR